ncbi:MAG: GDSL-type esterase/lipase family protein [Patescibacteria group bacterium]
MNSKLKYILISILIILIASILFSVLRMYLAIRKTKVLMSIATPYQRSLPHSDMKILVLGDSTAYGTGSEKSSLTTAGRLGDLFPQADIQTIAENGLKINGLLEKVKTLDTNTKYSLILVQIGANDIMKLTPMKDIENDINTLVDTLAPRTNNLIIMHSGNIGESEFFPFYLRSILSNRSKEMREIYVKQEEKDHVHYVDLINSSISKLTEENPTLYYANDMLHLNGAGYGLWFDEIRKKI